MKPVNHQVRMQVWSNGFNAANYLISLRIHEVTGSRLELPIYTQVGDTKRFVDNNNRVYISSGYGTNR